MSSITPSTPQGSQDAAVYGDALLSQLRQGWAGLPNRTLMALAMGGLRVRMMRSAVTMLSIVFAIAFLSYTGLSNQLVFHLASHVRSLEQFTPVPSAQVAAAITEARKLDLLSNQSIDAQKALARAFGMHKVDTQANEIGKLDPQVRRAELEVKAAKGDWEKLKNDPKASGDERVAAEIRFHRSATALATLQVMAKDMQAQVNLGRWIDGKGDADSEQSTLLTPVLKARADALLEKTTTAGRLSDAELKSVVALMPLVRTLAAPQTTQVLDQVLDQEKTRRAAADLAGMLRRAGVNVTATLQGDPLDTWLIIMALLTCAVGIANAMLMSVTERIREIGTMKCLGAQDNLIIKLFLLESIFLGLVGAVLGIVIGVGVSVIASVMQYKSFGLFQFPWISGWVVVFWSMFSGMLLAVAGAVYPAYAASRMKPVDALRVDE